MVDVEVTLIDRYDEWQIVQVADALGAAVVDNPPIPPIAEALDLGEIGPRGNVPQHVIELPTGHEIDGRRGLERLLRERRRVRPDEADQPAGMYRLDALR